MLLKVLVRSSIFDELRSSGQYVRIGIKGDWLDNISGEQMHKWLDLVHFCMHHGRDSVIRSEAFEQYLSRKGLPLHYQVKYKSESLKFA